MWLFLTASAGAPPVMSRSRPEIFCRSLRWRPCRERAVQVRFGVSSRAIAQFQRPANLHPRSLGKPQVLQSVADARRSQTRGSACTGRLAQHVMDVFRCCTLVAHSFCCAIAVHG